MAPKKDKKKEDDAAKQAGGTFTEVERTFMELQIAECNRKIARLRTAVDEYEQRNEELQKAYDKLDEDRADIIAYLKKTLNVKNEENTELKEKVKGLEETREIETAQFKETVAELERNFTIMKDQLTSENKLLAGKLNTLEEFRAIRDDLMRKFEKQEQDFKDQEMKYKRIIYDAEKKFVIGKDKLKKEMEARLLQLAQDFQDATELRIAASTHRVIRENIAINNELDNILSSQAKLAEQNERFRESERAARVAMELAEEERDKAINKNVVQLKVIEQLTTAFQDIKKEKALFAKRNYDFEAQEAKIQRLTKENDKLSLQVRILEQNLHAKLCEQNKGVIESGRIVSECAKLKKILKQAAIAVQAALKLDQWATTDPSREIMDRQMLLSRLLDIMNQYKEIQRTESAATLASLSKVYEEGDLGFVPKPVIVAKKKSLVAPRLSHISKDSIKAEKESSPSISVSSSTLGSIKTIPSLKLLPESLEPELVPKDSLPSFQVSSRSSKSASSAEEEETEMDDIEKRLEQSKLEIQKSIMKDLLYSQTAMRRSQAAMSQELSTVKAVTIAEGDEAAEGAEGGAKMEDDGEKTEEEGEKIEEGGEKTEEVKTGRSKDEAADAGDDQKLDETIAQDQQDDKKEETAE